MHNTIFTNRENYCTDKRLIQLNILVKVTSLNIELKDINAMIHNVCGTLLHFISCTTFFSSYWYMLS